MSCFKCLTHSYSRFSGRGAFRMATQSECADATRPTTSNLAGLSRANIMKYIDVTASLVLTTAYLYSTKENT